MGVEDDFLRAALGTKVEGSSHLSGATDFSFIPETYQPPARAPQDNSVSLFFQSAFSSGTKEFIGGSPSEKIARFRSQNPVSGFLSHLVGSAPFFAVPFVGPGARALGSIPAVARSTVRAKALTEAGSPFLGGALREVSLFAPLEAGRVGASLFSPEEGSFERTLTAAGADIIGLGVLGGGFEKLRTFRGTGVKNSQIFRGNDPLSREGRVSQHLGVETDEAGNIISGFNRNAPDQVKFEILDSLQTQLTPDNPIAQDVNALLDHYRSVIPRHEPIVNRGGKARYVRTLAEGKDSRPIEALFQGGTEARFGAIRTGGGIRPRKISLNTSKDIGGAPDTGTFQESKALWDSIVPPKHEGFTQYPRQLVFVNLNGEANLLNTLRNNFQRVGDGAWMVRENSEGLYIGVKRVSSEARTFLERAGQRVGEGRDIPGPQNNYFIFKTNRPADWFPDSAGLYETNANLFGRNKGWRRAEEVPDSAVPTLKLLETVLDTQDPMHASLYASTTRDSQDLGVSAAVSRIGTWFDELVPESVKLARQETADFLGRSAEHLRGPFVPARLLFTKNPRGVGILNSARTFYELVGAKSVDTILGKIRPEFLGQGGMLSALRRTAANPQARRTGGTQAMFEEHLGGNAQALHDFNLIKIGALTPEEAAAQGLHAEAVRLATRLNVIDENLVREIELQAKALGQEASFVPKKGHYTIAASWVGPFRTELRDSAGELVGYASGFNPRQAGEEAIRITELLNSELAAEGSATRLLTYGFNRGQGDRLLSDFTTHAGNVGKDVYGELPKGLVDTLGLKGAGTDLGARQADVVGFAAKINLGNPLVDRILKTRAELFKFEPQRFVESKGLFGARGTPGTPFSIKELQTVHSAGIIETNRYLAREGVAVHMGEQLSKLALEDPIGATRFNVAFNSMNGVQGPVAKTIDEFVDRAAADFLGPGSAMRMVRSTNEAMFMLTLGAWDIGFAALNALTPIQTNLSETALVLSAPLQHLQKYYSNSIVRLPEGGFRRVSFLDTARFAKVATQDLLRPDEATRSAVLRGIEENVIGRQFVETVHGGMRAVAEGQGGIWNTVQRWSEAPVVFSEEASRTYSYLLGRRLGKDFFLMEEEAAHEFARQFVNRTMFGYSAADRPRVLTGALGAGWGLFKNWTSNYVGNLVSYSGQAARGNWHPLLWSMIGTGAVGGVTAVPFAGMASSASNLFTDKSLNDLLYEWVGNDESDTGRPVFADLMSHGFPSLLGFTLRSRASAPSSHLMTDITMYSNIAILDRAVAAGSALGSFASSVGESQNPLNNPEFRRMAAKAFAPRTLQRAMTSFGDRGVTSLQTGNSLVPALETVAASLATIGLTPLEVANTFEVQQSAFTDGQAKRDAIAKFGERWATAELNADWMELRNILRDLSFQDIAPYDAVMSSAVARVEKQQKPFLERQYRDYVTQQRLMARGVGR